MIAGGLTLTYIKVKGVGKYLYRAVDSNGNTLDFLLTARRDGKAAKRFLRKMLQSNHIQTPRVINTDKNGCYVKAIRELKESGELPNDCEHRPVKYLNNKFEQDCRFLRHRIKVGQHFRNFWSAQRTLKGYEAINMIRKGQIDAIAKVDISVQVRFVQSVFGLESSRSARAAYFFSSFCDTTHASNPPNPSQSFSLAFSPNDG